MSARLRTTILAVVGLVPLFACQRPLRLDRDRDATKIRTLAYSGACLPFAMMSALAYDGDGPDERRARFERILDDLHWHRDPRFRPGDRAVRTGLSYDVWVNDDYRPALVVIAVRGTEASSWKDWWANAWWLTRVVPMDDQYAAVAAPEETGRVFAAYRDDLENRRRVVITTGHSLGAGLAQTIHYAYPWAVRQTYAFDPSPVTAHSRYGDAPVENHRTKDGQPFRFDDAPPIDGFPSHLTLRVYEAREVLSYLRSFLRTFYPITEQIIEVRFGFSTNYNFVAQHNMAELAECLRRWACLHLDGAPVDPPHPWWRTAERSSPAACEQSTSTADLACGSEDPAPKTDVPTR